MNRRGRHARLPLLIGLLLLLALIPFALYRGSQVPEAEAAWWNPSWQYRQSIAITNNTTQQPNVYISVSLDTSNTSKFQADCGDLRFTKQNGQVLPYYITGGCGTASTNIHVQLDTFPAGAQTFFAYYGNPATNNGSSSSDFLMAASSYTIGGIGSEETGPGPVAYWKFDEGGGSTAYASVGDNDGTITDATWANEDQCVSGKCLDYNNIGTVTVSSPPTFANGSFSVTTWINVTNLSSASGIANEGSPWKTDNKGFAWMYQTDGRMFTRLNNGTGGYTDASTNIGDISGAWHHVALVVTNETTLIYYVDGRDVGSHNISAQSGSGFDNGPFYIGRYASSIKMNGAIDELKIFSYALTEDQIKTEYNLGAAAVIGTGPAAPPPAGGTLSDSLVAHWAFDEQYGQTAHDKVGNNHGTFGASTSPGSDDPTWKPASECKVNGCLRFETGDYVRRTMNVPLDHSVSFWMKPTAVSGSINLFSFQNLHYHVWLRNGKTDFTTHDGSAYQYCTGNRNLSPNEMYHILVSYDHDTNAKQIYINGQLDRTCNQGNYVAGTANKAFTIAGVNSDFNYSGLIDEFKIYNTALTADLIKQDMNAGASVAYSVGQDEADELEGGAGAPPIAEWKFDEKQGTTAYDTSGNGNDGTVNGATWKSGCQQGACLEFDGGGQYVSVNDDSLNFTSTLTVEAWVRTSKADFTYAGVVSRMQSGSPYYGYELGINSAKPYFHPGGTYISNILIGSTSISDGEWHHLAGIYDGNQAYLFLDGKLDASGTRGNNLDVSSEYLDIGINYSRYADRSFDGQIDHVRIYDYARTPAQIAYDYNRGAPIAHWKFDECEGSVAHDSSGNENHGVISSVAALGTCNSSSGDMWADGSNGKYNASLDFDNNASDSVTIANSEKLQVTDEISVCAWVKDSSISATHGIFEKTVGGVVNTSYLLFVEGAHYRFRVKTSSNRTVTSTTPISQNQNSWAHLCGTFSKSAGGALQIYVNGKLDNSATYNENMLTGEGESYIGKLGGNIYPMNGQIDDVRIYNYALSPAQVQKVYNQGYGVRYGLETGNQ